MIYQDLEETDLKEQQKKQRTMKKTMHLYIHLYDIPDVT